MQTERVTAESAQPLVLTAVRVLPVSPMRRAAIVVRLHTTNIKTNIHNVKTTLNTFSANLTFSLEKATAITQCETLGRKEKKYSVVRSYFTSEWRRL